MVERVPRLEDPDTGPGGMDARMEEEGYQLRQRDYVSSRMPLPEEARALRLGRGVTLTIQVRVTLDQDGQALEVTDIRLAGDRNEPRIASAVGPYFSGQVVEHWRRRRRQCSTYTQPHHVTARIIAPCQEVWSPAAAQCLATITNLSITYRCSRTQTVCSPANAHGLARSKALSGYRTYMTGPGKVRGYLCPTRCFLPM